MYKNYNIIVVVRSREEVVVSSTRKKEQDYAVDYMVISTLYGKKNCGEMNY